MTLASLIRKRDTGGIATAIPAISATQPKGEAATVARIATVAVANPANGQTGKPANDGQKQVGGLASFAWLIHFTDREPLYVTFSPEVTHAIALASYPGAVAAEPASGLNGLVGLVEATIQAELDDRITCTACRYFSYSGICSIAYPGSPIVSAMRGYHPALPDMLQRCAGHEAKPLKGQDHD